MHQSSMANMKRCVDKYCTDTHFGGDDIIEVVDIGALDVNGSYASLFSGNRFSYTGIDMAPGKGVDLVISDPYSIPLPDNCADIVLSGQMLEHNKFFWLTFAEKIRLLKPNGFCFMIAPSRGPIHRYPVDCYRYYPDAYAALAEYTNSVLVDCWIDTEAAWGDLVGVWTKTFRKGLPQFDTGTLTSVSPPRREPGARTRRAPKLEAEDKGPLRSGSNPQQA